MPNWSDDEGRCHFEVKGVPCYQSPVGCPAHGGSTPNPKRPTPRVEDAVKKLENERDHFKTMLREREEELLAARQQIEWLQEDKEARDRIIARLERIMGGPEGLRARATTAYRRGAEAMREAAMAACNPMLRSMVSRSEIAETIRTLPIPKEKA